MSHKKSNSLMPGKSNPFPECNSVINDIGAGFITMASGKKSSCLPEINIGVIGYGFMGKAHSIAFSKMPCIFWPPPAIPKLVKICGRNKDRVAEEAKRYGYKEYCTDWKEITRDGGIDIVVNLTPHYLHSEICIDAAENGKNLVCEKPLAVNILEAKEMLEAVQKAGIKHLCNYNYRMLPALALARQIISEGRLGKIYHFRAVYLQEWLTDPAFPLTWAVKKSESGSGALGGIGSHIIDLARWLCGEPKTVTAVSRTFTPERPLQDDPGKTGKVDVDDAFSATIEFDNGAIGTLEASRFCTGRKNGLKLEVNGQQGSIFFDLEDLNSLYVYFRQEKYKNTSGFHRINVTEHNHPYYRHWWPQGHAIGWADTFVNTAFNIIDSVINDRELEPWTATFNDGYRATAVCDAILEAARTGRKVNVTY